MHLEAIHVMPDKFLWPSVLGGDYRFTGAPGFQDDDAKRLVPARHADHIAGLVEVDQDASGLEPDKTRGVRHSQLLRAALHSLSHISFTGKDEFRALVIFQNRRNGFDEEIGALLIHHATHKKYCRIQRADRIPPLDFSGLDPSIVIVDVYAVVNHRDFPVRDLIHPLGLVLKRARHRNHSIGPVGPRSLLVPDAHGLPATETVPASAVLRRVNSQDSASPASLPV